MQTTTNDPDEERVVLERGMSDVEWHEPSYIPPLPPKPLLERFRQRLPDWADYEWARSIRLGVVILLVAGVMLFSLFGSLRFFRAEGLSMEPTLHNGDHVIVNRLAYSHIDLGIVGWLPLVDIDARWNSPNRSDVIVFHSPVEDRELVKRVIGLPGDSVKIEAGGVLVNGIPIHEQYSVGKTECGDVCEWTVPDNSYFVLGDNRGNSLDSREGWSVPIDNIAGEKLITY